MSDFNFGERIESENHSGGKSVVQITDGVGSDRLYLYIFDDSGDGPNREAIADMPRENVIKLRDQLSRWLDSTDG